MFSVHTKPEEFEKGTITSELGILFEENCQGNQNHYRDAIVFKMFSVHAKTLKAGVFKFLRFEKLFREARFREGLVWTVGLNVEIKSSGIVWALP